MTTQTATLADFLMARIAEDERRLDVPEFIEEDSARGPGWGHRGDGQECPLCGMWQFSGTESVTEDAWLEHADRAHQRSRVLAECEAKRRIVEWFSGSDPDDQPVMKMLALPYISHPDYRPEWRP